MHVVAQQFGVVVEHFFEVRHHPALVDTVAMEPAGQLIVNAASRHLFECRCERLPRRARCRDSPRPQAADRAPTDAETSAVIQSLRCVRRTVPTVDATILSTRARLNWPPRPEKPSLCSMAAITLPAVSSASSAPLAPNLRHGQQNASDSRPAVPLVARNVGAAEVRPPIRREKRGQRPPSLPADRRHRRLVARVHIRSLIAIDLHGHKMLIDERGHLGVFIRFAIHHVAPVAPHRSNVEKNRLVFSLRARECSLAPRMPFHRLMSRGAQIR